MNNFNLNDMSYDIDNELKVRDIFRLLYQEYNFDKNPDKYDYDLIVSINNNIVGYIEVEHAQKWIGNNIPDNWYCYSFLNRKIESKKWCDKDMDRIIYAKFNVDSSYCFSIKMTDLINYGKNSKRSGSDRCDKYIELPFNNNCIRFGYDNVMLNFAHGKNSDEED